MSDLPLIGRGRAADVFDAGNGRVLRRYRTPHPGFVEREALAMEFLRSRGAPVPEVFSAGDGEIVMERLDGPTMLEVMKSKPWRAASIGREFAELHLRIHRIPAGDIAVPRFSDGDAILHFDLHPDNVILTADGPMIIDWSNVAIGDARADMAYTWMLMATSSPDDVPLLLRPVVRRIRGSLVRGFVGGTELDDELRHWVESACERRLLDPNAHDHEKALVREFQATHGRSRS
jgi:aminoglycoside phosphotransferase (APT) family kinase protein